MRQADTKRIDIRQTEQKQINGGLGGGQNFSPDIRGYDEHSNE